MTNILEKIVADKRQEVKELKSRVKGFDKSAILKPDNFFKNFKEGQIFYITEIKRGSPSKGVMNIGVDANKVGFLYAKHGASAISVVTESKYFYGRAEDVQEARRGSKLPILRKDFIIDEYQIKESLYLGASAILLIVGCLSDFELKGFLEVAKSYGLSVIVEIHDDEELERALSSGAKVIGINNRNLKTFETDIEITKGLIKKVPEDCFIISESGISERHTIEELYKLGVNGFLMGEVFMVSDNIESKLEELLQEKMR